MTKSRINRDTFIGELLQCSKIITCHGMNRIARSMLPGELFLLLDVVAVNGDGDGWATIQWKDEIFKALIHFKYIRLAHSAPNRPPLRQSRRHHSKSSQG